MVGLGILWQWDQEFSGGEFRNFVVGLGILWWWDYEFCDGGPRNFVVLVFEYLTKKIGMAQYLAKMIIFKICKSGGRIWEIGKNYKPEKCAKILQVKSAKYLKV